MITSSFKVAPFDESMPENQGGKLRKTTWPSCKSDLYQCISYYMAQNLSKLVRIYRVAILSFSVSYQAKFYCFSLDGDGKLETIAASHKCYVFNRPHFDRCHFPFRPQIENPNGRNVDCSSHN